MNPVRPAARAASVLAAVALTACGGAAASSVAASAGAGSAGLGGDWTRFGYDAQRSSVGPADTGITGGNVGRLQTRVVHLDGTVDASAVDLHGVSVDGRVRDVAIVTTTYGRTIALDPGTGSRLWEFVPGDIGSYEGSAQITNATPVVDPDRQFVYAASPDGRIHKLVVSTGNEIHAGKWPVRITFDASKEKLGGALNISGRYVLAVTGGYDGDAPTYEGHVVSIDRGSGRIAHTWNAECSDRHHLLDPPDSCGADTTFGGSAIWARAGAVVEPGSGRLLVATGNGPFNGSTNWGDSVLELTPDASRLLHNFTPTNQASLDSSDTDLGSTEPAVLPAYHGFRLAVQGGKDGQLRLLNINRLNGTRGGAGGRTGGELQSISTPGGNAMFTQPAVWARRGGALVFVADGSGTTAYALTGGGRPRLRVAWSGGSGGTSPVLAGGLLYVYDPGGALKVYEPASGRQLASLDAAGGHWNSPIVIGGRVILPVGDANEHATTGELFIYHLPGR